MKLLALANLGGAFLGLLLATALLSRRDAFRNASRSLGALIACGAVIVAVMVLYQTRWIYQYPALIGVHTPLALLMGPLFWFYLLHAFRPERGPRWYDALHGLPFLAYVVWLWPVFTAPLEIKLGPVLSAFYDDSPRYQRVQAVHILITLGHSGAYFLSGWWLLLRGEHSRREEHRNMALPVIGISLVWAIMAARFLLDLLGDWVTAETALLVPTAISVLLYAMGFHGLTRAPAWGVPRARAYRQSGLSREQAAALAQELCELLRQEPAYLEPDFNPARLAALSGYSRHQISEALNRGRGQGFRELVNELRCSHAYRELQRRPGQALEALAFASGFSSRSTFYAAFKRQFGESPGTVKKRFLSNPTGPDKPSGPRP